MGIYKQKDLKKPNLFQRMLGIEPSVNAIIEINNLFVEKQTDIDKLSLEQIVNIANKYKVNLHKKFKNERLELFQKYLQYCLADNKLEDSEIRLLKHIREILVLNERDTKNLIKIETERIYETKVKDAVSDGIMDEFEKKNLERLKKDLLIDENIANKIYEKNANEILKNFIDGAISDERLSPEEESEMNEIARSLGVDIVIDEKSKGVLDRYKLYWQIENGELPEIIPDINIQKSEKLHFKTSVNWLEQRRVTKRINYGGPTARIKIAKGVYYRVGSIGVQPVSEDVWKTIDSGQIYLTNKRLIFMGTKGNKTIRLNKILDISPFKNGVNIQKETGKNPFIEFSKNVDIFSMILVRLMNEM